jgi:hypothetical protein
MFPARQGQFLRDGIAADNLTSLEHNDGQTCLGKIPRTYKTVVAGADHNDVSLIPFDTNRSLAHCTASRNGTALEPDPAVAISPSAAMSV